MNFFFNNNVESKHYVSFNSLVDFVDVLYLLMLSQSETDKSDNHAPYDSYNQPHISRYFVRKYR